ncbi:hypothetical protein EOI86_18705 [Hwanghaeella grinnelliae]|uniref:Uncharacterized protein n=1 Tax=Hwanghaeella grinnelliae TaxID=2500179 RepID=A0A3S2W7S6_9PROT|nr:hypothetical protein [Hwanghaeella grinnelliae]RVU34871.1 hypothetical protein EOI86_18705 [Hwanghaeella grinnelliae]
MAGTGVGLPAGITFEAAAGTAAFAGGLSKGIGAGFTTAAHLAASYATGDPGHIGPAIFSGVAGLVPTVLRKPLKGIAAYFQDKIAGHASETVGYGNIPEK